MKYHQRNTFLSMPVTQEEGDPAAWIPVDECQARLIEPQFVELLRTVESRIITKKQVNNYTIMRDMQATIREVTAKRAVETYQKPPQGVLNFLLGTLLVGAVTLVSVWCYMYL